MSLFFCLLIQSRPVYDLFIYSTAFCWTSECIKFLTTVDIISQAKIKSTHTWERNIRWRSRYILEGCYLDGGSTQLTITYPGVRQYLDIDIIDRLNIDLYLSYLDLCINMIIRIIQQIDKTIVKQVNSQIGQYSNRSIVKQVNSQIGQQLNRSIVKQVNSKKINSQMNQQLVGHR